MAFNESLAAWGCPTFRTWDKRADEYLRRGWEMYGNLNTAIDRAMRDGFQPRYELTKMNTIENVGLDLLLSFLNNESVSGLGYVALGTSTMSPDGTETQLQDEFLRIPISSTDHSIQGQLIVTGYFDSNTANQAIGSAAIFGNGATGAANTGTPYSMVGFTQYTKNNLESATMQWQLGLQRTTTS